MNPSQALPTRASADAVVTVSHESRAISCTIAVACAPEVLYEVWMDVAHWHVWDPDTKQASLDGPPFVGATGKLAPRKGMPIKISIVEASKPRSFTVTSTVLGTRMFFYHRLEQATAGESSSSIVATHEVRFEGWLAGLLMKMVGADVIAGLPLTMTRLKYLCESAARGQVGAQNQG
jgi:hypothetical protein